MNRADEIPIQVEAAHGNLRPLLFEIMHALDRLLDDGIPTTIDLAGLPFAPRELERLEDALGHGELVAELDALGKSRIRETAYPGVWWVEHRNANNEITGRYLEVTRMPEILCSQNADIGAGRARLGERFETKSGRNTA